MNESVSQPVKWCSVVDLFCGVGGLTHGFVKEGFKVIAGVDSDVGCRYAYETNNNAKFIHKKVEDIQAKEIRNLYPRNHVKILVGCAPCQPFSTYTKKNTKDKKWQLLYDFANLVDEVRPHVVSMENVPDLIRFNNGKVFSDFVERLSKNYQVTHFIVSCPSYGIPQNRTRLVLFASKFAPIELVKETHTPETYLSVRDAIGHLPKIEAGQVYENDHLHRSAGLSDINLRRIKQSIPGGTWRDWDKDLIAECHKKNSGKSYDSVYGRMKWETPSPTITTECNGYGNGRFGHPEQDRAISMREAAIFQSFPDNYKFLSPEEKWNMEKVARLIGNAVPVKLGNVIAQSIKKHIGR
jgi:DNA (cytosine-5)-methyltransferase 1